MTPKLIESELLKRATLFTLTLGRWGNRKKADLDDVTTDADKKQLSLSKHLIRCDAYDAINTHMRETKAWCMQRCMPSFLKAGIYVVKLENVPAFEMHLAESVRVMRDELVPAFIDAYPGAVESAREALGTLYNVSDYPEAQRLSSRFYIDWAWIGFGVPDNIPEELRQQEADKLRKKFVDAEQEILYALREGFRDLLDHAIGRLAGEPGKAKPVIRESLVGNLHEFFETFESRNLMDDDELSELVEQARKVLNGASAETLRSNKGKRANVAQQFQQMKSTLDAMLINRPSRFIDTEE